MYVTRACLLAFVLFVSSAPRVQVSGSVYTTDRHGDVENLFNGKTAVYMAGGPGPNAGCSGNGLPNGTYVFQVTNPSGSVLLSSDAYDARVSRKVEVSGGVIVDADHSTKPGPCLSRVVKLAPFDDTPSNGKEYKVWLTPFDDYVPPVDQTGEGFFGFDSSFSKTDNFKVRGGGQPIDQTTFRGTVFYDEDNDGTFDPDEIPVPGWRIEIDSGVERETFADGDGNFEFIRDLDFTTHTLTSVAPFPGFIFNNEFEENQGRWLSTTNKSIPKVADAPEKIVNFGVLFFAPHPEFARSKGYWHNQGEADLLACDPAWRVVINGSLPDVPSLSLRQNFTDPEDPECTTPFPGCTLFTVTEGAPETFGLAFNELSNYLVGNPAHGILAFILSTQFCAGNLNRTCGPMAPGELGARIFIDRFEDGVLVEFEEIRDFTRGLLEDPRAADTGPGSDPVFRQMILDCLDEWNGMNSIGDDVHGQEETPPGFPSPYP